MAYSEASKRATMKYVKANYERIYVSLPKGHKDVWKEAADSAGESLTSFIVKSVEMRLGKPDSIVDISPGSPDLKELMEEIRREETDEEDSEIVFRGYLRALLRSLNRIKAALEESDTEKSKELVERLIEDTQNGIED